MSATRILLALAAVQIALILVTWHRPDDAPRGSRAVVDVEAADVRSVHIESSGDDADTVVLRRSGDAWVVASAGDYPAQSDKVEELLGNIADITVAGEPIAARAVSHTALGVGATDFGRRITVEAESGTTVLTVGRSDSGGLNVRLGEEAEVYAGRGASEWDFAADPGSYVDRELVSLERDAVDSILVENANGTVSLARSGDAWAVDIVPFGRVPDDSAIDRLVGAVTTVRFSEPVAAPPTAFSGPVARATWSGAGDGGPISGTLEIGAEVDGHRYVRLAGESHTVLASSSSVRAIVEASPLALSKEPEPVVGP